MSAAKSAGRRVHILVPTFQPHDAVGNDAAGMYFLLREAGYDAVIFAEHVHAHFSSITRKAEADNEAYWEDPDALLIYHHAIDWELGEKILKRTRNRIVIKYHNVTPAEFFANYSQFYYWACVRGRESTARLAQLPNTLIWGDSSYNNLEFIENGVSGDRCRVVAPLHHIDDVTKVDFDNVVLGTFRGGHNILFVGGMRPNKGHTRALEVLAALRRRTSLPVKLFFVGSFDANLAAYTEDLQQYIRYLDLGEDVFTAHSVSPAQLRAYYMTASVFLCVSEHEGFCVPLVEAMAFRVPIVAWATTAVGETAGEAGLLTRQFDAEELAGHIADCLEDPQLSREMSERGRLRYEKVFHLGAIQKKVLELTEEAFSL